MRFMSKNPKLNIVLRPAIPADNISGRAGIPGLYVLFENHEANVEKQEIIDLLLKHPGYHRDYFEISEENVNELLKKQQLHPGEPTHIHTELEYGHIGKTVGKLPIKLSPEMQKLIAELASSVAKDMFDQYVKNNDSSHKSQPVEEGTDTASPEEVQNEPTKVAARGRSKK